MSRVALLLTVALVASCAAPGEPQTAPEKSAKKAPLTVIAVTPQKTAPEVRPDPPGINLLPMDPAQGTKLSGRNALDPQRLIGLPDGELERLLGPPDFRRKDPPAEIWQYRRPACLLDVFMYQDKKQPGTYTVNHVEARGLDVKRVSGKDCLLSVLRERNQG